MVALRAILKGVMRPEEVGTAGGTYEGEWFDGEWEGMGSFSTANGDVYLGEFHRGKYHGRGMQELQLGGFYKGWWVEGRKEGNGTMFYANGDIYEGGWLRDTRHGWGKLWFWDGRVYEGYWRYGLKHGWGRETIQRTGQVFEGKWQDGLRYGHGAIHYGNGDAFYGNFVDDERQGDGVMHYADPNLRDSGADLKASFMFGEPRNAFSPIVIRKGNLTAGSITMYVPQDSNQIADNALEYWGISNTNYLVGTGYAGTG
ncbi:hypothetical protein GUITHDRAFT_86908 [Guillardia theta CCMP2712]|uniref:Uncharacterized protein n=2 Tax=Guillardia theta TaxID=55529 RepID=L1JB85_GUITC|nr:hypothetical protein GUITHDRAFT_86908 [Guillardia theta CCMP2712]EKX45788.1 hypothetical protein GUITHDRAFT_86908 [Guillardia theta CCMP2712]|eukprot:XP_005832768.1 hypothetical protein GUITHDRAFT_86908 [Guillardia theta CCMP2712]